MQKTPGPLPAERVFFDCRRRCLAYPLHTGPAGLYIARPSEARKCPWGATAAKRRLLARRKGSLGAERIRRWGGAGMGGWAATIPPARHPPCHLPLHKGERAERCQRQEKRGERVAAVEKIEEKRKPEDFFRAPQQEALGRCRASATMDIAFEDKRRRACCRAQRI